MDQPGQLAKLLVLNLQRIDISDLVNRVAQYFFVNTSLCGNLARGAVSRFLNQVAGVSASPFPFHTMLLRGQVQFVPPIVIRFATEAPTHSFDYITRISEEVDVAGFKERL